MDEVESGHPAEFIEKMEEAVDLVQFWGVLELDVDVRAQRCMAMAITGNPAALGLIIEIAKAIKETDYLLKKVDTIMDVARIALMFGRRQQTKEFALAAIEQVMSFPEVDYIYQRAVSEAQGILGAIK